MKVLRLVCLLLLGPAAAVQAESGGYPALSREMKSVWTQDSGVDLKRGRIAKLYPKLSAAFPKNLAAAGTGDLGALMEALNGAWYFLEDEGIVEKAEKVFGELARRRFATVEHIFAMQAIYIGAHRFDDARRLREEYPEVDTWAVPASVAGGTEVSSGPYRYYGLESNGGVLRLGRADLSGEPAIIFYGSPECRFTSEMLSDLSGRPSVKAALLARALFITTDDDFRELAAWNKKNPWKYHKVYSRKDWPAVKMAGAPELTFFAKGEPVCYVRGWHGESTVSEITKCLETAGLMTDAERMRDAVAAVMSPAAADLPLPETRKMIADEYAALKDKGAFGDAALAAYTADDLGAVFDFLNFHFSGKPDPAAAERMLAVYALMEKAGRADAQKGKWVFDALLADRDFAAAKEFRAARPGLGLPVVPEITSGKELKPGQRLVYVMGSDPGIMRAEAGDTAGLKIIMVSIPGCHFSGYALKAIEGDPRMLGIFKKYGRLLTRRADFPKILKRNSVGELKYGLVASEADWPELDLTSSPVFYFLKDGKVLYSFNGWPREGKFDELFVGLGRLGLLGE